MDFILFNFLFPFTKLKTFLFQIVNLRLLCVPSRLILFLTRLTNLSFDFLRWLLLLDFFETVWEADISCFTDFIVFDIRTERNNSSSSSIQFNFLRLKCRTVKAFISAKLPTLIFFLILDSFLLSLLSFSLFFMFELCRQLSHRFCPFRPSDHYLPG